MPLPPLLITGASGFVGSRLLSRCGPGTFGCVYGVTRMLTPAARPPVEQVGLRWVEAELPTKPVPDDVLASVQTVIHLAAAAGKARPATYFAVNAEGTRALLEQCARCGVRNFLYVSSIAARFQDVSRYYYAQSKRMAETVVASSGLRFAIVRPTLIGGRGGGAWEGLMRLARLPVTPVFGSGRILVQPIDVDDLAEALLNIVQEDQFTGETIELGGPERVPMDELLRHMRKALGRKPGRLLHLPLRPLRAVLGWLENWFLPILPMTAGQLSSFAEDGTAEGNPLLQGPPAKLKRIDDMIASSIGKTA